MMKIGTWVCGSCAAYAIESLGSCDDALQAMLMFCNNQLVVGNRFTKGEISYQIVAAHYVFIAGPEAQGSYHSKKWIKYGSEFAQFILDNSLGRITTLPATSNIKHHPSSTCQVWVWQPDQATLEKWYKEHRSELKCTYDTGRWITAAGVAGAQCPHCSKTFTYGEKIYNTSKGEYMCETYGIEAEKQKGTVT